VATNRNHHRWAVRPLDDTTKAALMELGLDDPAIREAATVTVEIA
jgi:hypothetical protein